MTRFEFSLNALGEQLGLAGSVTCGSLSDALQIIGQKTDALEGDQLEIGVPGFPPARFVRICADDGSACSWKLVERLAA